MLPNPTFDEIAIFMTWNFTGFNKYIPELCKGSLLGLT
jgi:hypothetical protein